MPKILVEVLTKDGWEAWVVDDVESVIRRDMGFALQNARRLDSANEVTDPICNVVYADRFWLKVEASDYGKEPT